MSEEREAKNEWITVKNKSAKFWATANDLGLTKDETHNALNFVKSAYDFTGALDEALKLVAAYAELKARAVEKVNETVQGDALFAAISQLSEAPMIAWTHFQKKPGHPTWAFTIRPELPPDLADVLMKETFRQIGNFEKWLDANDFRPVYRSNEMAASPVPAPTQPQPPKAKSAPAPTPPTGTSNGAQPPQPPTGGAPPAPEQKGNGEGSETTYTADSITAQMTPNGNRCYAVRGGTVKRHGATAWPEVAAQLKAITDYDPANLEIGKLWDVSSFGIRVLATIPAGKQYPNKVVNFFPAGHSSPAPNA